MPKGTLTGKWLPLLVVAAVLMYLMHEAGSGEYVIVTHPPAPTKESAKGRAPGSSLPTLSVLRTTKEANPANRHESKGNEREKVVENTGSLTDMLTAVVMSYPKSRRFHRLEAIICKVAQWHFVEKVVLVWNGEMVLLPSSIAQLKAGNMSRCSREKPYRGGDEDLVSSINEHGGKREFAALHVVPQEANRIDNRWRIGRDLVKTQAVLNMDDDIDLSQDGARCMLSAFRASPDSLVAIDVRSHTFYPEDKPGPFGRYRYIARDQTVGYKRYSIALPRALLTNHKYYLEYDRLWRQEGGRLKPIVDDTLCDDIAFNFVAASVGAHVLYVKANYAGFPEGHDKVGALTHLAGMKEKRQKCLNQFVDDVFHGEMPLKFRRWHVVCSVDG